MTGLDPQQWEQERDTAYRRARGLGVALRAAVVFVVFFAVGVVVAATSARADVVQERAETSVAVELAATGPGDGAVIFVAGVLCVLVGVMAWGVGSGRKGGER